MIMAVENMAHNNMSVKYIIRSAKKKKKKKPTYDKIQKIRNRRQRKCQVCRFKVAAFLNEMSTNGHIDEGSRTKTQTGSAQGSPFMLWQQL